MLRWVQTATTTYELFSDKDLVAILHWERGWGSRVFAEAADGKWFFRLNGMLHPSVMITPYGSSSPAATVKMSVGGEGVLEMPEGLRFYWVQVNWWRSEWAFTDFKGSKIVLMRPTLGSSGKGPAVELERPSFSNAHVSLLILLGWYLMVLKGVKVTAAGFLA